MIPIEVINGLLKSKYPVKPGETVPDQAWFTRKEVLELIKSFDKYLTTQYDSLNSTTQES